MTLSVFLAFVISYAQPLHSNDSSLVSDYEIAFVVREAVRAADSTLLNTPAFGAWRDYLKVAATNLRLPVQPLLLIKFDGDRSFRSQLKRIIEWEKKWRKKETEHFIYYYRWDQPPPEIILDVQDAHFNEIVRIFDIDVEEKIPFRYDLTIDAAKTYPYEDLRGGIVSPQPFDLYNGALSILNFINPSHPCFSEPLARIYGSYFQNPSTAKAFYDKCSGEVRQHGYTSAINLLEAELVRSLSGIEKSSAYLFVFDLVGEFGPQEISRFLSTLRKDMSSVRFEAKFEEVFAISLHAFESKYRPSANKS